MTNKIYGAPTFMQRSVLSLLSISPGGVLESEIRSIIRGAVFDSFMTSLEPYAVIWEEIDDEGETWYHMEKILFSTEKGFVMEKPEKPDQCSVRVSRELVTRVKIAIAGSKITIGEFFEQAVKKEMEAGK